MTTTPVSMSAAVRLVSASLASVATVRGSAALAIGVNAGLGVRVDRRVIWWIDGSHGSDSGGVATFVAHYCLSGWRMDYRISGGLVIEML